MKCSWVECSEGLSSRVSNIIRRYIDHMNVAVYVPFFVYHILSCYFDSIFYHCLYSFMFCMLLFIFVCYVFLFIYLCIRIFIYVLFSGFCFIVFFYVLF